jgi:predicted nucleic acid-binding protein
LSFSADTSFVCSLYVPDVNSDAATRKFRRVRAPLLLTDLVELEFVNAMHLRVFRKQLLPWQIKDTHRAFREDVESGVLRIVPLPAAAFEHALRMAAQHTAVLGTRSLGVLHVAAAIALKAETFFTFDERQSQLAVAEGLRVP